MKPFYNIRTWFSVLSICIFRIYSNYLKVGFGNSSESFHRDVMTTLEMLKNCRRRNTLRSCLYNEDVIRKFKVRTFSLISDFICMQIPSFLFTSCFGIAIPF